MTNLEFKILEYERERKQVVKKYSKQFKMLYLATTLFILAFACKKTANSIPQEEHYVTEIENFSEN